MRHLFADSLHIFVIVMIVLFVTGGILAITGTFDHWGSRYILKRRRRKLMRDKSKQPGNDDTLRNDNKQFQSNANDNSESDKRRYA